MIKICDSTSKNLTIKTYLINGKIFALHLEDRGTWNRYRVCIYTEGDALIFCCDSIEKEEAYEKGMVVMKNIEKHLS